MTTQTENREDEVQKPCMRCKDWNQTEPLVAGRAANWQTESRVGGKKDAKALPILGEQSSSLALWWKSDDSWTADREFWYYIKMTESKYIVKTKTIWILSLERAINYEICLFICKKNQLSLPFPFNVSGGELRILGANTQSNIVFFL